ncbi:hypothetical protein [Lederbergia galactosidilytica]|uniref:Uncharacterized protein n=1 Tax=Lederbergia galactosidilytica TaxID=217031 RepID=A0A177ZXJ3_9BACI|nr:hypothetical protein [Lederbergia galactosidilytica]OAK72656.1 hypothetical protein ABB05_07300 [Lederbergia galactosidilytica]
MPQQRLYYDFMDGHLMPFWYVLSFDPGEIDWDKQAFYYDAIKPFVFIERGDFDESLISMSISLSDLLFNMDFPNRIGINLKRLKRKIESHRVDPYVIQQFILSTPEINDFLMFLPARRHMEFVGRR